MIRDKSFIAIEEFIRNRSMLYFEGHKRQVLKGRLEERIALLGLPDLAAYLDLLRKSCREEAALLDLVTTNETFFFRNLPQFDFLMKKVIPGIEKEKDNEVISSWGNREAIIPGSIMKMRILCAGCSTGEEPYSIAMALLESLRYPKAWDIEILAGDLSENCVKKAVEGFYEYDRLKGLPDSFKMKYLKMVDGGAMIRDEVKKLIRFCPLNLAGVINGEPLSVGVELGGFDLIFCRKCDDLFCCGDAAAPGECFI